MQLCSQLMARPFGNGLIHLLGKWEDRDNYLPSNMSSFKWSHSSGLLQPPIHLPGMCSWKKVMIKVMLLMIQIRASECAPNAEWALLEQWTIWFQRKLVREVLFQRNWSVLESQEWTSTTIAYSCILGWFPQTAFIQTDRHTHVVEIT